MNAGELACIDSLDHCHLIDFLFNCVTHRLPVDANIHPDLHTWPRLMTASSNQGNGVQKMPSLPYLLLRKLTVLPQTLIARAGCPKP